MCMYLEEGHRKILCTFLIPHTQKKEIKSGIGWDGVLISNDEFRQTCNQDCVERELFLQCCSSFRKPEVQVTYGSSISCWYNKCE